MKMEEEGCCVNPKDKDGLKMKAYHIGGIPVEFPYQPYGTQLAFMGRVISTLDRALRDGHCHALLESPTGTGKSLSLLCSVLAWQQHLKSTPSLRPDPRAISDPLSHGGGFVPESQPPGTASSGSVDVGQSKAQKKKVPTIYYASRTHSQISQVIREYRKTSYRVPMSVLASRKHYCTNPQVNGKDNLDEECKLLLKDEQNGCLQFKSAHKIKSHPSIQKGGCHEVHDIEDLVKVGQVVKGCSYYAARSMAEDAQLVFCPYNYIINPVIRGAMSVDVKGAILVLDEAHNIEDIARDAGSVDLEQDVLDQLQSELEHLCNVDPMIYQPLLEITEGLISWMEQKKGSLEKRDFQHYFSCWTGDKALKELQEANISQQNYPILLECATKAIKAATEVGPDADNDAPHLTGKSVITLEGLFSSVTYFFSRNGSHVSDYQLALQRCIKRDKKNVLGEWTVTLSLWCMHPAVVFRDLADLSLSVILTSGTLSPMNSFSSELGIQFGTCLDAPHVVDVQSQVSVSIVTCGPDNYPLNASYKTADSFQFQDVLGKSLQEIFMVVPAGCLVFFPSYKLMEKLCNRWRETGQWSRLNGRKSLFVEPRGGSQEDFDSILKDYYKSIHQGNKPYTGRKKRIKKMDLEQSKTAESKELSTKDGAAFLAVCRGKVSEGLDFSDDNARAVIVIGIPFPNINDIKVNLKKKYNDAYKKSKTLLSGDEWYCHQAFRSLNQAAGRCIRHRSDYGAIILLDERYKKECNRIYISKWLRNSVQMHDSFDLGLQKLKPFFRDAKETANKNMMDSTLNFDDTREKNTPINQCKVMIRGKKLSRLSEYCERSKDSSIKSDRTSPILNSLGYVPFHTPSKVVDKMDGGNEIIDLECDSPKYSSYFQQSSRYYDAASPADPDITFVKETPATDSIAAMSSPGNLFKNDNSSSMFQATVDLSHQTSFGFPSLANRSRDLYEIQPLMEVTPKREFKIGSSTLIPEVESSLNLSMNSHTQKRRRLIENFARKQEVSFGCNSSGNSPKASEIQPLMEVTPKREFKIGSSTLIPEVESSLNLSVNSHTQKRRRLIENFARKQEVSLSAEASDCITISRNPIPRRVAKCRIESDAENNISEESTKSDVADHPQEICDASCISSDHVEDKSLHVSCASCKSPLGPPERHLYVRCSLTSSSKVHLLAMAKEVPKHHAWSKATSVHVLLTDSSSLHQKFCKSSSEQTPNQGVWSEEDGCVFNSVFCPFCTNPCSLGVQIMATDASNIHLLNKILLFVDCLEIQNSETPKCKTPGDKDLSPGTGSTRDRSAILNSIDKFSYSPQEVSGGWRTTKSKLRLPKKQN